MGSFLPVSQTILFSPDFIVVKYWKKLPANLAQISAAGGKEYPIHSTLSGLHSIMIENQPSFGEGWGVHVHPISLYLPSRKSCSSWEGRYTPPVSNLYMYCTLWFKQECVGHFFAYCMSPIFFIFERYLDSNPESCCCGKQAHYQISHTSPLLSHPSP